MSEIIIKPINEVNNNFGVFLFMARFDWYPESEPDRLTEKILEDIYDDDSYTTKLILDNFPEFTPHLMYSLTNFDSRGTIFSVDNEDSSLSIYRFPVVLCRTSSSLNYDDIDILIQALKLQKAPFTLIKDDKGYCYNNKTGEVINIFEKMKLYYRGVIIIDLDTKEPIYFNLINTAFNSSSNLASELFNYLNNI